MSFDRLLSDADDTNFGDVAGLMGRHPFFSGEPGPPGTEHLWGDYDYEGME